MLTRPLPAYHFQSQAVSLHTIFSLRSRLERVRLPIRSSTCRLVESARQCRLVCASHPATQPPSQPTSHPARPSMPARSTGRHRRAGIHPQASTSRLVDAGSSMPASHHPPAFLSGRCASRGPPVSCGAKWALLHWRPLGFSCQVPRRPHTSAPGKKAQLYLLPQVAANEDACGDMQ